VSTAVDAGRLWQGLEEVPAGWGPCVVTIGVFDGVHRGHARLIERAVERARDAGLPAVLVTFDPHPAQVVGPPRDTARLSTPHRRADLAHELGVDAVLVLRFTEQLARTPAEEFVRQVLVDGLGARCVVVGADFRFGARGAGHVGTLHELGRRHGFTTEGVDLLHAADARCSSTRVRSCLSEGDTAAAADVLGRPHRVEGRLSGGALELPAGTAVPAPGHYVGVLTADGGWPRLVDVTIDARRRISVTGGPPATGTAALDFLPARSR
jgi:riboflavin kinase/FMN adenylyltransferase